MIKKILFLTAAVLILAAPVFGQYTKKSFEFVDEFGRPVNMGTSVSLYIYDTGGTTEQTCYLNKEGTTTVTQPVTDDSTNTPLDYTTGVCTFYSRAAAFKVVATDGTYTRTIDNRTGQFTRFMWPTFLTAMSGYALSDSDDLTFGTGLDWAMDSDTAERLDMIPAADGSVLAIGDGTYQADVYFYVSSTAWMLFDEGNSEVYMQTTDLQFDDDADLSFGDDDDFTIDSDTTKILDVTPGADTDDYIVNLGLDQSGVDLKIFGATTGEYWSYDASADTITVNTGNAIYTMTDAEANQFKVDGTGTIDGDAINLETTNGGIMLNADGAAYGDIELNSADDSIFTCAGDMTATVTGTAFIDATADVKITSSKNAANAVLITEDGGTTGTIKIHADTGNAATAGAASLQLTSDIGAIQLLASANVAATEKASAIQLTGTAGAIELYSGLNATNAIKLTADGGAASDIVIFNDQGTSQDSVYILTDEGGVKIAASAVPDGQYGLEVSSAIAGGTKSEGSAIYAHTTLTGNIDAPTYNLGSWLDITGGTPTATVIAAGDFGVYESGANLTGTRIVGLQIQTQLDSTNPPNTHYMMRFNTNQSGDTPDAWFEAANWECMAGTTNTGTTATKSGAIKVVIQGTDHWIRVYNNYN